jgi:Tfp pilus assembly protein FimT
MCRASSGFTVLELLLVVGVMVTIAAFAVPGVLAARAGYQLSTSGYTIASKLDEVRTLALKRNRQAWLLVDPATRTLQVQAAVSGGGSMNIGGAAYLPQEMAFPDVTTTQQVMFDMLGRSAGTQTIRIQHTRSGLERTITVASTGRISVQ